MTIWYDVSDISTWSRNHLTGIQRTVVGILGGLLEINVPLRLVRFNVNNTEWEIVDIEQLPDNVKSFLSIDSQRPTSQKQKFIPQEEYSNKQKSLKQTFLGRSHQTTEYKNNQYPELLFFTLVTSCCRLGQRGDFLIFLNLSNRCVQAVSVSSV